MLVTPSGVPLYLAYGFSPLEESEITLEDARDQFVCAVATTGLETRDHNESLHSGSLGAYPPTTPLLPKRE